MTEPFPKMQCLTDDPCACVWEMRTDIREIKRDLLFVRWVGAFIATSFVAIAIKIWM